MLGIPFGVAMGLFFFKSDGSSSAEAEFGALVTGIPFGLLAGRSLANWQKEVKQAEGDLPGDKVELAHKAATGGPVPADAEVRSAAASIAALQLAPYSRRTRKLTVIVLRLLLATCVIGAIADSLSALLPALLFAALLFGHWYHPRQLRRRLKLLTEEPTPSSDQNPPL